MYWLYLYLFFYDKGRVKTCVKQFANHRTGITVFVTAYINSYSSVIKFKLTGIHLHVKAQEKPRRQQVQTTVHLLKTSRKNKVREQEEQIRKSRINLKATRNERG